MNVWYRDIYDSAIYSQIEKNYSVKNKPLMISGCVDTQKVHLLEAIGDKYKFKVVITYDEAKAREIQQDAKFFDNTSVYYPAKDFIFYSADIHGNQLIGQRIQSIKRIIDTLTQKEKKLTVVTTIDGCADLLMPISKYIENTLSIKRGQIIDSSQLIEKLIKIGYERSSIVEEQGKFAVRGGIIDIYSYADEVPVRIEFFDDEVDSIRSFDIESQRSIEKIEEYTVFPATECIVEDEKSGLDDIKNQIDKQLDIFGNNKKKRKKEEIEICNRLKNLWGEVERTKDYGKFINVFVKDTVGFLSYFPEEDTLFVIDEPNRIQERMDMILFEYTDSMKNRLEGGYVIPFQTSMMLQLTDIYAVAAKSRMLMLSMLDYKITNVNIAKYLKIDSMGINSYNNSFEYLVKDLQRYKKNRFRVILVCNSRTRATRIVEDLSRMEVNAYFSEDYSKEIIPGTVMVTYGNIHRGFEYPLFQFVVITENDVFTNKIRKKIAKKKYSGKQIASFNELNIGDIVVHEMHGVGIYKGIEKIEVEGTKKDYIKIEYADNSCLYVLATQLDRLQKYADSDTEKKPKLNKLGTKDWNKTKSKVYKAVEEVAKDLVELYSKRQKETGYSFSPDTVWQTEFEEVFPYEETNDQLVAISDTKNDMESTKIMDRLICGDVGYGKTEVAIRAAFKAVQDGKQVAYLVPTTILAQQHFRTFEQRMRNFPVTVAQLSSFRTSKEIKETLTDLRKGFVDVVIGTHRLLSKDVEFKDLGLLIVDEEQRFGVTHKERIKQLKNNIDVLTLSATPIPRTLHMSLVGIRDMSVLEEPPVDRMPIQTFVTQHNDEIIREAINRELARNGQVYYVYNKVKSIDEVAIHLQTLIPEANIAYAHGQMDKRQLEHIMSDFINHEIDVLISTTIIETGVDISNVNTMIIEDADKFGLSQLYQLRGRVGRSNRTAYAFLLYRRDKMLSEVAEKRLSAIREFSELGSGFKIAMKDLEIRGAGNVLGKSQHGHMAAVGYDLYCKMLNEAVNNLKGIKGEYSFETNVELTVDAYIPATYIKSEYQKLDTYKRIATIENEDELIDMQDELSDRYGKPQKSIINLLNIALIKSIAHKIGIMEIKGGAPDLSNVYITKIKMYPKADINSDKIPEFISQYGGAVVFETNPDPCFVWKVTKKKFNNDTEYIVAIKDLLEVMKQFLL